MSAAIRTAIIGLGNSSKGKGGAHSISYCHGWGYKADSRVDLVAACSRNEKNVADFIQRACRIPQPPSWVIITAKLLDGRLPGL